jgi:hypothetical protein
MSPAGGHCCSLHGYPPTSSSIAPGLSLSLLCARLTAGGNGSMQCVATAQQVNRPGMIAVLQVPLNSTRSFYQEGQKTPFPHLPWKTGRMHFHFHRVSHQAASAQRITDISHQQQGGTRSSLCCCTGALCSQLVYATGPSTCPAACSSRHGKWTWPHSLHEHELAVAAGARLCSSLSVGTCRWRWKLCHPSI